MAVLAPLALSAPALAQQEPQEPQEKPATTYIVQLESEPVAVYDGGVRGLRATRPGSGERVDRQSTAAKNYADYLRRQQNEALGASGANRKDVVRRFDTAFNGVAVELTGGEAAAMRKAPGVINVWEREMLTADTTTTPDYLGLTGSGGVWDEEFGGPGSAGEGMVVGIIDSGIWPENPSFDDMPGATVPGDWNGDCENGTDPDTDNRVSCNNKVIGARYYHDDIDIPGFEFESPRDHHGHGSHTAGTAAGNVDTDVEVNGVDLGQGSGMAPRAHIAAYKALWSDGQGRATGSTVDILAAIEEAVTDGVDVINYSVSGSRDSLATPIEVAFLTATAAGVFVATSAGNGGDDIGAGSVAHNAPWTATVAASTHDRNVNKTLTLGDDSTYQGVGVGPGLGPEPLVYAGDIPAQDASQSQAAQCWLDIDGDAEGDQIAIDAAGADGKIVICDRGGEVDRVEKSAAVSEAGGVGMVHANTSAAQSVDADLHSVPTVHVTSTVGASVKAYESSTADPTATIGGQRSAPVVAPEMAGFSSYGPALAGDGDLLKPDITAPGVDVLAAVAPPSYNEEFGSLSGTSMSTPHIAGLALLLKQAEPTWSSAAVKSAMMTTARTTNSEGEPIQRGNGDATALDYGSGEVVPAPSYEPGLVYDAGAGDWIAYLCAIDQWSLIGDPSDCDGVDADPSDLNYPTIAIGDLAGSQTVTRTVTNVTDQEMTYSSAGSQAPPDVSMVVEPAQITVPAGGEATYEVTFQQVSAPLDDYSFGSVVWEPTGGGNTVTSQVAVQPAAVDAPDEIVDTGAQGSRDYTLTAGYTGPLETDVDGMVPAEITDVTVTSDTSPVFAGVTVPDGTEVARFATFDAEVSAEDTDLYVFNPDQELVDFSVNVGSSTEEVTVVDPEPGEWFVGVPLYSDETSAEVPVNSFMVGSRDRGNLEVDPSSTTVTPTAQVDLTASWSGLSDGRYLGSVNYSNGTSSVGRTLVSITVDDGGSATVDRLAGTNRFETAALVAGEYPGGVDTVYVANGFSFADSLSGAPAASTTAQPSAREAAGQVGAPILLTRADRLPSSTVSALESLDPDKVVVLGGEGVVQRSVAEDLEAYGAVERVGGVDRYDTSAKIARRSGTNVPTVYIASGDEGSFPDALGGGALAGRDGVPVLLTHPDRVLDVTRSAMDYLNPAEVVVLGGPGAVSKTVYDDLGADRRLAGDNRWETAVAISEEFGADIGGTYVASGEAFPDALASAALSGLLKQPLTLSAKNDVPDVVMNELDRLSPDEVTIVGGTAALSDTVEDELNGSYPTWRR